MASQASWNNCVGQLQVTHCANREQLERGRRRRLLERLGPAVVAAGGQRRQHQSVRPRVVSQRARPVGAGQPRRRGGRLLAGERAGGPSTGAPAGSPPPMPASWPTPTRADPVARPGRALALRAPRVRLHLHRRHPGQQRLHRHVSGRLRRQRRATTTPPGWGTPDDQNRAALQGGTGCPSDLPACSADQGAGLGWRGGHAHRRRPGRRHVGQLRWRPAPADLRDPRLVRGRRPRPDRRSASTSR